MSPPYADRSTAETIRELATDTDKVVMTSRAYWDMLAENLTKGDVCDAICTWIDAGKQVKEITTEHVPEHRGEPAYVMLPEVDGKTLYVKVTVTDLGEWHERLLIISSHP